MFIDDDSHPVLHFIWGMHDKGLFGEEAARRLIGSWFEYPQCCIDFYIDNFEKPDLTYLCIVKCKKLGTYVQCHQCWENDNELTWL